jgi:hypothetical protein
MRLVTQSGVVKTAHSMALNFYPIFIPLNHLIERILDFGLQISDLLNRSALSLYIKLTEFLKSKIPILKLKILKEQKWDHFTKEKL